MNIANYFIIVFISYYVKYGLDMLDIRNRKSMQFTNKKLNDLRKVAVKTVEEQKEFISLKYPIKKDGVKSKWTFKRVGNIFVMLLFYAGIFIIFLKIFSYYNINFKLWQAALIIFLGPALINVVLKKFGLQRNDVTVFFRRGGK